MLRFVIMTGLLSALITAIVLAGVNSGFFHRPSFFREVVVFLGASTIGLYWFTTHRMGTSGQDFIKIYLGATVLRILFFGGFIFAIIQLDPSGAIGNTVLFLLSYFLFTILEVIVLFLQINSQKSLKSGQKDL